MENDKPEDCAQQLQDATRKKHFFQSTFQIFPLQTRHWQRADKGSRIYQDQDKYVKVLQHNTHHQKVLSLRRVSLSLAVQQFGILWIKRIFVAVSKEICNVIDNKLLVYNIGSCLHTSSTQNVFSIQLLHHNVSSGLGNMIKAVRKQISSLNQQGKIRILDLHQHGSSHFKSHQCQILKRQ